MIKDLALKIGTKEQAFWTGVVERTEKELETLRNMVKFNEAILEMAKEKARK
jgi:hypothetical protein